MPSSTPLVVRWHRPLLWLAVILPSLLLILLIAVYVLLQPDRFTAMLQAQARQAGLELHLAQPASPSLLPRPAIDLHGITVSSIGANAPILLAARGQLALPWRALFGRHTLISRLQFDSPRVDLDALQSWLSAHSLQPSDGAPTIPRIDAGISIDHGSLVRGNRLLLSEVSLYTGSLRPDRPFPLTIAAENADGKPLQLRLTATPHMANGALNLQAIDLRASVGVDNLTRLTGRARWRGAADAWAQFSGSIEQADRSRFALALDLLPADSSHPLRLRLRLDGKGKHIDMCVPPLALADWWAGLNDPDQPTLGLPPLDGVLEDDHVDWNGISIDGLRIRAGSALPAGAGSAATPAPASRQP